jgi:surfeit locus 1 family protein
MRLGSLDFTPTLGPTLVTLLLFAGLLGLGFWQLDRAEQKRALLSEYEAAGHAGTVIRLEPGVESYQDFAYQSATASGQYDAAHQFLLDNRTYQGRAGYHVLTPLRLHGTGAAVLVNRGWIPLGNGRSELPDPPAVAGEVSVLGRVKPPVSNTFTLGEEEVRRGWPYRIQRVDTVRLAGELGYPLLPVVLLLDPQEPAGFVRDWRPLHFGPERNVGYAVQWFGLAAVLAVIYLAVNSSKVSSSDDI